MKSPVDVYLDATVPKKVGTAHFNLRRGRLSTMFSYDAAYLASGSSFAIDPHLPLVAQAHYCDGMPGAFRDSSPDRWGRNLIAKQQREEAGRTGEPLRTLDEVDYLLGVLDRTRQGALRFTLSGETSFLSASSAIPPIIQLPELLEASVTIAREQEGRTELKMLLDAGSGSLGGARPKASVVEGDQLMLAKFSHPGDEWDVMAWEKTALDLAQAAGIVVPATRLVPIGDQKALVLERFDRAGSRIDGARLPYLSAMSLLGARDGEVRDYAEVAEALVPFVGDADKGLEELFKRVVLSIVLHNVDDHLRNIGFVRMQSGWMFAPLFDVNPDPHEDASRSTTVMGEAGRDEVEGLKAMLSDFGLDLNRASQLVETVLAAIGRWQFFARRNGCRDAEMRLFAPVFQDRARALKEAFVR